MARFSAVCPPIVGKTESISGCSVRILMMDFLSKRKQIHIVGSHRICHDRGRIGIDQSDFDAFFPE
jgi:hypothetical protein